MCPFVRIRFTPLAYANRNAKSIKKPIKLVMNSTNLIGLMIGYTGLEPVDYGFRVRCLTSLANTQYLQQSNYTKLLLTAQDFLY